MVASAIGSLTISPGDKFGDGVIITSWQPGMSKFYNQSIALNANVYIATFRLPMTFLSTVMTLAGKLVLPKQRYQGLDHMLGNQSEGGRKRR
jgi:hypothetical protein